MVRKLIGLAGLAAIIIVGYGAIRQRDTSISEAVDDTQPTQSAAATAPAEAATATESSAVSASEANVAPAEEIVVAEVEPENEEASLTGQPAAGFELPQRQNQLSEGDYPWSQLLPRDGIRPIYDPKFVSAQEAPYDDNELVIGLEINGQAKAYAIGPLNSREMVNDTLGGVPILVTW